MFSDPASVWDAVDGGFGGAGVLVVGDLMLDVYVFGDVARVSPEAPVPVVRLSGRRESPGGAGNVLRNLSRLGLQGTAAGLVGDDEAGCRVVGALAEDGIGVDAVLTAPGRKTTTKTRVVSGHHQLIRLDEESSAAVGETDRRRLIAAIGSCFGSGLGAVILSDYGKGTLSAEVCRFVIDEARGRGLPVLVDPKGRDFGKYAGATALTPNLAELELAAGLVHGHGEAYDLGEQGRRIVDALGLEYLAVTCGAGGIRRFDLCGTRHFPAARREVFDVSGAGDTVIATLAASTAAGLPIDDAHHLANLAAGLAVGKAGTAPVGRVELLAALRAERAVGHLDKICDPPTLDRRVAEWRARGDRVVFTNGCFDLLHPGHVTLLARARREGDRLVVGLNSDRSVRELKGPSRPVVGECDRAQVLAGLSSVDAVVLFDDETPLALVERIRPDVLVKGSDYIGRPVAGAEQVRGWGGSVVFVSLVEGQSTTRILERAAR